MWQQNFFTSFKAIYDLTLSRSQNHIRKKRKSEHRTIIYSARLNMNVHFLLLQRARFQFDVVDSTPIQ